MFLPIHQFFKRSMGAEFIQIEALISSAHRSELDSEHFLVVVYRKRIEEGEKVTFSPRKKT
jgi:hypothetical protein